MNISPNNFLKLAAKTAEHFGFRNQADFESNPECKNCTVTLKHEAKAEDRKLDGISGLLTGGLNAYVSRKLHALSGPIFFYDIEEVPRTGETALTLHIFNVEKSIAEAILIQTIRSLLNEIGEENHIVKINSLGDSDSRNRYSRELTSFLRKRLDEMPPQARDLFRDHATNALLHLIELEHDLANKSPSPLEHLSDTSRRHFRDIVEYLDMSETPYEIDPKLIGNYQCFNDALFSFDFCDEQGMISSEAPLIIKGGRYGSFIEKYLKQSVPAVGAVVILKGKKQFTPVGKHRIKKPAVHVVHLGFAPKIRSLLLIDELRRGGIMVDQDLASDSLSTQLRRAEESGARFSIIIGQKEYVDGTVILRDMIGKNQETIPLGTLIPRLKRAHVVG